MARLAQQLVDLNAAPESFDPADIDGVSDNTSAKKKKKSIKISASSDGRQGLSEKSRLAMRSKIPVLPKYAGKKVARKDVFAEVKSDPVADMVAPDAEDEEEEEVDSDVDADDSDDGVAGDLSLGDTGNFSISADLEDEYEKMMKRSSSELSLLRTPSAAEMAKKDLEAKELKSLGASWSGLVQLRIHLESALGIAHRLPAGKASAIVHDSGNDSLVEDLDAVSEEARALLGTMLDLQHNLAEQRGIPTTGVDAELNRPKKKQRLQEEESWATVDAQMRPMVDWGLAIADEWKERTRLDARRSFKVLDQSLSAQMRAVSEVEPEKIRRRCAPPPGRHKVFGVPNDPQQVAADGNAGGDEAIEVERDIFDDREFYVHLLREVLAGGGASHPDGEDSRELQAELQGRRSSKKRNKAEVERRASKGRKIRYVSIEKLQNFMAPRPRSSNTTTNNMDPFASGIAVDALLRSLFGSTVRT